MKKVMITGAGSGLGAALTESYIKAGYFVILLGRTLDKLEKTAQQFDLSGKQTDFFSVDVSDINAVKTLKEIIVEKYQSIEVLVNCAGLGYFGPLESVTSPQLEAMFNVNTFGTIYMTQQFIPITKERIMNIISTAGLKGKINESAYVASKFAVRGFTESLQKEYEDKVMTITGVYMGGMATPFWDGSSHIKDMSRLKSPKHIADKIVSSEMHVEELIL